MFTKQNTKNKKTSRSDKSSELSAVLNTNLEKHNAKINKARLKLISMVILALCKVQTVSLTSSQWLLKAKATPILRFADCSALSLALIYVVI
jgi:hypothetical protein